MRELTTSKNAANCNSFKISSALPTSDGLEFPILLFLYDVNGLSLLCLMYKIKNISNLEDTDTPKNEGRDKPFVLSVGLYTHCQFFVAELVVQIDVQRTHEFVDLWIS